MKAKQLKGILDRLPHAFDHPYWDMANTSYKDEVFLAIIQEFKIPKEEALKLQSKVLPGNKIVRQVLKEEAVECMGCYGKDYIGTSFYGSYVNEYNREGKGVIKIELKVK